MKISVLIPTLGNRELDLEVLVESLKNQTYKNFEVIIISQDNYEKVDKLISKYKSIEFVHIKTELKGLSRARNIGMKKSSGEIIVLSDDDCWYEFNAFENIVKGFNDTKTDILLTKIFSPNKNCEYKNYLNKQLEIKTKFDLLSRSSIEISFKNNGRYEFDELFGLGSSEFNCCEEVDFLIRRFISGEKIVYIPLITVNHPLKNRGYNSNMIKAKGALYSKNFNFCISILVLFRDLIKKREFNFIHFFSGYFRYKKIRRVDTSSIK